LTTLLDGIHPSIIQIGEIRNTIVDDCGTPAIFMHRRPRVPVWTKHVLARGSVDDDGATALCGSLFDVVDGCGGVIYDHVVDGDGLREFVMSEQNLFQQSG
jgi:hypothetical protein